MTATVRLPAILCLLAVQAAPLPFIAAPAMAQEAGETRCGADGHVERFVVPNYGRPRWLSTTQSCRGRSGRYARNEEYYDAYAPPEDGESRCGADRHVERFVRPNYGTPHWMSTTTRCNR